MQKFRQFGGTQQITCTLNSVNNQGSSPHVAMKCQILTTKIILIKGTYFTKSSKYRNRNKKPTRNNAFGNKILNNNSKICNNINKVQISHSISFRTNEKKNRYLIGRDNHVRSVQPPLGIY